MPAALLMQRMSLCVRGQTINPYIPLLTVTFTDHHGIGFKDMQELFPLCEVLISQAQGMPAQPVLDSVVTLTASFIPHWMM